jgi:hypothetical protein
MRRAALMAIGAQVVGSLWMTVNRIETVTGLQS